MKSIFGSGCPKSDKVGSGWPSGLKIGVHLCIAGWLNLAALLPGFDEKYKSDKKTLSPWMGFLWHMDSEAIKKVGGQLIRDFLTQSFIPGLLNHKF